MPSAAASRIAANGAARGVRTKASAPLAWTPMIASCISRGPSAPCSRSIHTTSK
jgi:hypothetical protein